MVLRVFAPYPRQWNSRLSAAFSIAVFGSGIVAISGQVAVVIGFSAHAFDPFTRIPPRAFAPAVRASDTNPFDSETWNFYKPPPAPEMPERLESIYSLLLDLPSRPQSKAPGPLLPVVLEKFWEELASSPLGAEAKELLLYRVAEFYGHGTLRPQHVEELALCLKEHGARAVLDPIANTGFHSRLLAEQGLQVEAADESSSPVVWRAIVQRAVNETRWDRYAEGWALFLSWAPDYSDAGEEALGGFKGGMVAVLGDDGAWTGTPRFHEELRRHWKLVKSWDVGTPWPRVVEHLRVFVRQDSSSTSAS